MEDYLAASVQNVDYQDQWSHLLLLKTVSKSCCGSLFPVYGVKIDCYHTSRGSISRVQNTLIITHEDYANYYTKRSGSSFIDNDGLKTFH